MTITFTDPERGQQTMQAWKDVKAPCYLRKTSDPCTFGVVSKKDQDSLVCILFLYSQLADESSNRRLRQKLLEQYSVAEMKKALKEVEKYRVLLQP